MIALRDFQESAAEALSRAARGIVKSPAGSGKTVIGAAALDRFCRRALLSADAFGRRKMRVVWLGHTTEQCDQAREALALFPGIAERADVVVACYQGAPALRIMGCDVLIVDECHHAAAPEFAKAVVLAKGRRWGLSATPKRADLLAPLVFELLGLVVAEVEREELVEAGHLARGEVVWLDSTGPDITAEVEALAKPQFECAMNRWVFAMQKDLCAGLPSALTRGVSDHIRAVKTALYGGGRGFDAPYRGWLRNFAAEVRMTMRDPIAVSAWDAKVSRWDVEKGSEMWNQNVWRFALKLGVTENETRNAAALVAARQCIGDGQSTLVLVNTIEHGERIEKEINQKTVSDSGQLAGLCYSKIGKPKRRKMIEAFRDGELPCLVATSLADEGFDAPRASRLVLVSGGRSAIKAEQRTGRVLRAFAGKESGVIYDFQDTQHPFLLAQSRARARVYKALGYSQRLGG